jgi:hypothetical protein
MNHPGFLIQHVRGRVCDSAFLISSQVLMLMLPVWVPQALCLTLSFLLGAVFKGAIQAE